MTCKAWQVGFDAAAKLAELRGEKRNPKRATWHHFRELWVPKWSEAFRTKIEALTGESTFSLPNRHHAPEGRRRRVVSRPDDRSEPAGC